MKLLYGYIIVCLVGLLGGCNKKSGLPDMRESFQYKSTKPFGSFVAHEIFKEVYQHKIININKKAFDEFRSSTYADNRSVYWSLSKNFYCSKNEANNIIDFVKEGHSFFLSANYIDTVLLSKVNVHQTYNKFTALFFQTKFDTAKINLSPRFNFSKNNFEYYYYPFNNSLSRADSSAATVLGYNAAGQPNFMVIFIGKGRLYLHCEPRAFSNYFLLKDENYLYMQQVMQLMNETPGNIFWDDYYNKINYKDNNEDDYGKGKGSALAILFKYPELTIAFWLVVGLLLLYIFFNGKRRQRIIKTIPPVENTSIQFTQAIAGLYMAEKNNRNIADKMVTYFNDFVRTHYFLNVHANKEMVTALSKKSGIAPEKVQALYNTIEQIQLTLDVSDFELLTLNEQIQYFYKNRN
ncbi:MAG TPA: hypothetical protein PKU77_09265 [Ferruginibacter sp.]|nr:hypothetical protein [Ferruginibacter sp.]